MPSWYLFSQQSPEYQEVSCRATSLPASPAKPPPSSGGNATSAFRGIFIACTGSAPAPRPQRSTKTSASRPMRCMKRRRNSSKLLAFAERESIEKCKNADRLRSAFLHSCLAGPSTAGVLQFTLGRLRLFSRSQATQINRFRLQIDEVNAGRGLSAKRKSLCELKSISMIFQDRMLRDYSSVCSSSSDSLNAPRKPLRSAAGHRSTCRELVELSEELHASLDSIRDGARLSLKSLWLTLLTIAVVAVGFLLPEIRDLVVWACGCCLVRRRFVF